MDRKDLLELAEKIPPAELAFVDEYLREYDLTAAASLAFPEWAPAERVERANKLLKRKKIAQYTKGLFDHRARLAHIDGGYVLQRLVEIDQLDCADLLDPDGDILPLKQWPRAWRVNVEELVPTGKQGVFWPKRFPAKAKNLELIGKHVDVGAFREKEASGGAEAIAEALAKLAGDLPG